MTISLTRAQAQRTQRWPGRGSDEDSARRAMPELTAKETTNDGGFTLVEAVIGLVLVAIFMSALVPFLVNTMQSTALQSQRQSAVQLANDAMDQARSVSNVVQGRYSSTFAASWASRDAAVTALDNGETPVYDAVNSSSSGIKVLLANRPTQLSGRTYNVAWYISGSCGVSAGGTAPCTNPASATAVALYHVVIEVTWAYKACASGTCSYVSDGYISNAAEPIFNSAGVAVPVITGCVGGTLTPAFTTVPHGQAITPIQMHAGTSGADSTTKDTWTATTLPPGVTISSSGLISGTPSSAGPYSGYIYAVPNVTSGFQSQGKCQFSWTIS